MSRYESPTFYSTFRFHWKSLRRQPDSEWRYHGTAKEYRPHENSRISRRAVLAGVTAIPVLTCTVLNAAPIDPLVALFTEHQRLEAAWVHEARKPDAGKLDTPEHFRLWHVREETESLITDSVATTPDGLAAQLEFAIRDR